MVMSFRVIAAMFITSAATICFASCWLSLCQSSSRVSSLLSSSPFSAFCFHQYKVREELRERRTGLPCDERQRADQVAMRQTFNFMSFAPRWSETNKGSGTSPADVIISTLQSVAKVADTKNIADMRVLLGLVQPGFGLL